jgi:glycosyltransferase involved in cell wall biosynthesis
MKKLSNVDFIFVSACDHNEGTNNHGLFQMFDFFRNHIQRKSIFVSTQSSIYTNNKDIFDLSRLGGYLPLANQINAKLINKKDTRSWINNFGNEKYKDLAAKILISQIPKHKFIVIADKSEIELSVLEKVLKHFNSKLLIISASNSTWTGLCEYPEEFKCQKYKTSDGCSNECPALSTLPNFSQDFVSLTYSSMASFVERNKDIVFLNVGNKFSFDESSESHIFKEIKKSIIPLKTIAVKDTFEDLWKYKLLNKKDLIILLKEKYNIIDVDFIMMWSAHSMLIKRKGMDYFIDSLHTLKKNLGQHFDKICLIICAQQSDLYNDKLKKLGIKYVNAGFIDREQYNKILSGSDLYCSTTISDAGPRTTYEAAALATPVISFDFCNASDFVNSKNGSLVKTYDSQEFAKELHRLFTDKDKKSYCENMYKSYRDLMDTDSLVKKWNEFFKEIENNEV